MITGKVRDKNEKQGTHAHTHTHTHIDTGREYCIWNSVLAVFSAIHLTRFLLKSSHFTPTAKNRRRICPWYRSNCLSLQRIATVEKRTFAPNVQRQHRVRAKRKAIKTAYLNRTHFIEMFIHISLRGSFHLGRFFSAFCFVFFFICFFCFCFGCFVCFAHLNGQFGLNAMLCDPMRWDALVNNKVIFDLKLAVFKPLDQRRAFEISSMPW